MAITKAMLARCQNELKQAFCALGEDVQKAMRDYLVCDVLSDKNTWESCLNPGWHGSTVYRLSPDTPTEQEWEELAVTSSQFGILAVSYKCMKYKDLTLYVSSCPSCPNFLGIIYLKNGIETLRTSVDAAFGTPVRVRFAKGDE